jgi:membrane protein
MPPRPRRFVARLLRRSLADYFDDHCPQLAASIAYHVLFSLFPLAIVAAGAASLVVHATGSRAALISDIVGQLPLSGSGAARLDHLLRDTTSSTAGLGLLGIIGLLYSASGMMAALRVGLNQAWEVDAPRPYLKGKLVDLALVAFTALAGVASLGLAVAAHVVSALPAALTWVLGISAPLIVAFLVVLFLYRIVPAAHVRMRDAWPAALMVSFLLVIAQNLFALYVANFGHYNAVYGSLGAAVAFMFFVYIAAALLLFGAEVSSECSRARLSPAVPAVPQATPPLAKRVRHLLESLWIREDEDPSARPQAGRDGRE